MLDPFGSGTLFVTLCRFDFDLLSVFWYQRRGLCHFEGVLGKWGKKKECFKWAKNRKITPTPNMYSNAENQFQCNFGRRKGKQTNKHEQSRRDRLQNEISFDRKVNNFAIRVAWKELWNEIMIFRDRKWNVKSSEFTNREIFDRESEVRIVKVKWKWNENRRTEKI